MNFTPCMLLAACASAVSAQPHVHSVAEPVEAREEFNEIKVLDASEIAGVGSIDRASQNMRRDGWIVLHTPSGQPTRSWIIEDNGSFVDDLLATYEDPVDKKLIVLQSGFISPVPFQTDLVLFKIDPVTGVIAYQWRYPGWGAGENLGMELFEDSGLIAASVLVTQDTTECTLLRFRNSDGTPRFHNRYTPVSAAVSDMRFHDVTVDPDTGDIFAVGEARIVGSNFSPETEILVARFDSSGDPVWFVVTEPRPGVDDQGEASGMSIELNAQGNPVITARQLSSTFGPIAVHIVYNRLNGAPLPGSFSAIIAPNGSVTPASSSLERLPDGTMLASGDVVWPESAARPAMWTFDAATSAFNWIYLLDVAQGTGTSAIPQPGEGLLLAGGHSPPTGASGFPPEALLARTNLNGDGLCPVDPDIREIDVMLLSFQFDVRAVALVGPSIAGLEVIAGDPVHQIACEPCRPDLNLDGSLDFFDINLLLSNMIDYNGDTVFDFFDISAFLMDFAAGCP